MAARWEAHTPKDAKLPDHVSDLKKKKARKAGEESAKHAFFSDDQHHSAAPAHAALYGMGGGLVGDSVGGGTVGTVASGAGRYYGASSKAVAENPDLAGEESTIGGNAVGGGILGRIGGYHIRSSWWCGDWRLTWLR